MSAKRTYILRDGWKVVQDWTFHLGLTSAAKGGSVKRGGKRTEARPRGHGCYRYPDDPSLLGEVLVRSFREGA